MNFDLQFYWGLFLRRLPVMTALFLVCVVVAGITALKLPPTYSTSAQLLVEEAQIPDSMIRSTVQTDANRQLQVIEQRLMTRANMLSIARKFDVFEDIRSMAADDIIEEMRKQTSIRRTGGRELASIMSVAFEARSGAIAANVVNEYVTLILQESNSFRMSRAEGTLTFFEQEVQRLNDDLDLQSAKIVDFKNRNANALPDDLTYRQNRQALLQERQGRLEREISALQKQRRDMITIFEATGRVNSDKQTPQSREEEQLSTLRFDLEQALAVYSETNPRVVMLRNRIEQLERTIAETIVTTPEPDAATMAAPTMLDLTLAEMDQRLETMREELSTVSAELEELEDSIMATASNAVTLNGLERDFENIQARYNEAVGNLNQARMNERIEISAQGQRVTVIENAVVPQVPTGPNRIKLIAAGIGAGGALAVGFFMLLELLNRTIRRPFEMQSKYGIIPIAVIPYMESRKERMARRALLVGAFLAALIGIPVALYLIDTHYMPLDLLANKVFDRLGLT
jgi:polysaccharide chain length determinant protein (PEP-CTERM system associated)